MARIQGFSTLNNKFETLVDKNIVKHGILTEIFIDKESCDWDLDVGTTINEKIFQYKTEEAKFDIIDDLKNVIEKSPFVELIDIKATDIEKGWLFTVVISYLGQSPEEWDIPITEETVHEFVSTGVFPLDEKE